MEADDLQRPAVSRIQKEKHKYFAFSSFFLKGLSDMSVKIVNGRKIPFLFVEMRANDPSKPLGILAEKWPRLFRGDKLQSRGCRRL